LEPAVTKAGETLLDELEEGDGEEDKDDDGDAVGWRERRGGRELGDEGAAAEDMDLKQGVDDLEEVAENGESIVKEEKVAPKSEGFEGVGLRGVDC
jgi:hypothetical protein